MEVRQLHGIYIWAKVDCGLIAVTKINSTKLICQKSLNKPYNIADGLTIPMKNRQET